MRITCAPAAGAGRSVRPAALAGFPDRENSGKTGDVKRLRGEVDRLLPYAAGQKIGMEDVREVAGPAALQDDWAMTNAIEAGQAGEALRQLSLMLDARRAARRSWASPDGWSARSFRTWLRAMLGAVESLFRTDLDLKRSGGDPRVLLERLVVELCGVSWAGPARDAEVAALSGRRREPKSSFN